MYIFLGCPLETRRVIVNHTWEKGQVYKLSVNKVRHLLVIRLQDIVLAAPFSRFFCTQWVEELCFFLQERRFLRRYDVRLCTIWFLHTS